MANRFLFGNVNSEDYGVYISGSGTFNKPSRRVERFSVPGRNGDLTIDEGCYNNVTVTYPCFIARGFESRFHDFMAAMMVQKGYQRLKDTYDADHFREALFMDEVEPEPRTLNRTGTFDLSFNCKPQRFIVNGDRFVDLFPTGQAGIYNPTRYAALPTIRIYGYGALALSSADHSYDYTVTVAQHTENYVDVDSYAEECHIDGDSMNQYVTIGTTGFPKLHNGETFATKADTITSVEIMPNWWEI